MSDSETPPRKVRSLSDVYESCDVALFSSKPQSFEKAREDKVWIKVIDDKIGMIEKNKTWELIKLPKEKEVIGLQWIYKTKYNEDGSVQKHKTRLVAKGYSQQLGVDFTETFAPMA